jgi:beta-1,4-N-acetylglucosaminyltransferase
VTTFVSVGNATQSFSRLIEAVLKIAPRLPQPLVVQHGNTAFRGVGCIAQPFMEMEAFGQTMAQAELLISHAGAGSVIHAIQTGKIPVVMPRLAKHGEIIDDHQLEFARTLAQSGKIVIAEEPADLLAAVAEAQNRQKGMQRSLRTPPLVDLISAVLLEYLQGKGK